MEFSNTFTVNAPLDHVWAFLIQPDKVTPCVPGAELGEEIGEGKYTGSIRVKLGPVAMTFRGEMQLSPDAGEHALTLTGKGRDTRGGGTASGTVVARLSEADGITLESRFTAAGDQPHKAGGGCCASPDCFAAAGYRQTHRAEVGRSRPPSTGMHRYVLRHSQ